MKPFFREYGFRMLAEESQFDENGIQVAKFTKWVDQQNILVVHSERLGTHRVMLRLGQTTLFAFTGILTDEVNFAEAVNEIRAEMSLQAGTSSFN